MRTLRVGLAQINVTVGDITGNEKKIIAAIAQGREWGVDVLAVPELAMSGYPPEDLLLKPHLSRRTCEALRAGAPR